MLPTYLPTVLLSHYVTSAKGQEITSNKRVIELGAGCGLPGMLCFVLFILYMSYIIPVSRWKYMMNHSSLLLSLSLTGTTSNTLYPPYRTRGSQFCQTCHPYRW